MRKITTSHKDTLIFIFLTPAIFFLTKTPITRPFSLQLLLVSLIGLIIYAYLLKKKRQDFFSNHIFVYLFIITILLLVGATGWFFSPFFFVLYLLGILLAFIFSPMVSIAFVVVLMGLFSFNIGEVDIAYDVLVVLSLLTTIPLSLYLRKKYLHLKGLPKDNLSDKSDLKTP